MKPVRLAWLIFGLAVLCFIVIPLAFAEPVAQAKSATVTLTLFNEPCALPAVSNLPKRATWAEGGKVAEGCWGGAGEIGVVVAYFEDRSVVAIPAQSFVRITAS